MLKISFTLSFCLHFDKLYSQINKLSAVHTLHCKVYTVQYVPYIQEFSKPEIDQGTGPKWKFILWHRSRLVLSYTLNELALIYNTYIFENRPGKYVFSYISISCHLFMPKGTVLVNNTLFTEEVPVNKCSLNKQTNKLQTNIRGHFLTIFSSITISKQTNYNILTHNRFSYIYFI